MLKIRDNQLHAFEALIKGKFLDDTTRYVIKENYPVLKGVSRPKVRERCDYSMKKALGYGIRRQADIASFITFALLYGPNFHKAETVRDVLESHPQRWDKRVDRLISEISENGWQSIAAPNEWDDIKVD